MVKDKLLRGCASVLLLLAVMFLASEARGQSLCPDPARPCGSFKPYELPFRLPPSRLARAEVRSAAFYAIILRTADRCAIPESDRLAAQALFPRQKVFVSRFQCDAEDNVTYTTIDADRHSILAVYAGATRSEASALLARVRRAGRFADAYLRRMQVVFVFP